MANKTPTRPTRPTKKAAPARRREVPAKDAVPLRKLTKVTSKLNRLREQEARLREEQIDAMFESRQAGWSLRAIGDAAGISNPRVHATLTRYAED